MATDLNNVSSLHKAQEDPEQTIQNYEKELRIAQESGDMGKSSTLLNNIGGIYTNIGKYETALKLFEMSLSIQKSCGISTQNTEEWIENTKVAMIKNDDDSIFKLIEQEISSGTSVEDVVGMLVEAGMAKDDVRSIVNGVFAKLE